MFDTFAVLDSLLLMVSLNYLNLQLCNLMLLHYNPVLLQCQFEYIYIYKKNTQMASTMVTKNSANRISSGHHKKLLKDKKQQKINK